MNGIVNELIASHASSEFIHRVIPPNEFALDNTRLTGFSSIDSFISSQKQSSDVFQVFLSCAVAFGFDHVANITTLFDKNGTYLVYTTDEYWDWVHHYRTNRLFFNDPGNRLLKNERLPFVLSRCDNLRLWRDKLDSKENDVVNRGMDFGMTQIINIPFAGKGAHKGLVRFMRVNRKPLPQEQISFIFHNFYFQLLQAFEKQVDLLSKELNLSRTGILSLREVEALQLTALGHNPAYVADKLEISQHTVYQHLRNIRTKLGVKNTMHAISRAIQLGELTLS